MNACNYCINHHHQHQQQENIKKNNFFYEFNHHNLIDLNLHVSQLILYSFCLIYKM